MLEHSDRGGPVAAEAHYLLAQIGALHVEPDLVAEQLNQLWDESPGRTLRSDVPERLVSMCATRMRNLADRPVDALDFFARCWRRDLDDIVTDTASLEVASRSMAALGLPEDALRLQLRATNLQTRAGEDDPFALAWLAELHVGTGRPDEALETIGYIRGLKDTAKEDEARLAVRVARIEGEALEALGRLEEAEKAYGAPKQDAAGSRALAARRGQLLGRMGRCEEALPLLDDTTESKLSRARCLLTLGRPSEAKDAVADLVKDEESTSDVREDASWLASAGAYAAEQEADEEESPRDVDAIWSALAEEEARARAFEARRTKR